MKPSAVVATKGAQADHMHHKKIDDPAFFGAIADAISGAGTVLLMGHGKGKANAMLSFVQFLERKRPEVARLVEGAVDHDLEAMTDLPRDLRAAWSSCVPPSETDCPSPQK